MSKSFKHKKTSQKIAGKPPGYLIYTGNNEDVSLEVNLIELNKDGGLRETENVPISKLNNEACQYKWINIHGLNDIEKITQIGEKFGIHPLTLEDVLNTQSRPKYEEFDDYIFIVLKMMYYQEGDLVVEHICFVLKDNMVFTFQELQLDVFNGVRERIRDENSKIRLRGADYLFYALVDELVDKYFVVFENFSDKVEQIETIIFNDKDENIIAHNIQNLKKEVFYIRKAIFPIREVINQLSRTENALITDVTRPYLRDVHDHSIQIIETVESYREITMSLVDLHMTFISNRMNSIMKILTIISTIFIPLTFIAGIYGMNFHYMPELQYKHAYPILWGVMFLIFVSLLVYFKKKKWF